MEDQVANELAGAARRAVGLKQVLKAIRSGRAAKVDAAREHAVPVETIPRMKELGRLSGIQVPSAAAALLLD